MLGERIAEKIENWGGGGGGGGGGEQGREVQDSPLVESFSADLLKAIESYWTELHFCNNNEATQ